MATNNKVALVTGGSSGIGLACVQRLRKDGFNVITVQRKSAEGFHNLSADLADPQVPRQIIEQVISHAGRLDVLINNAGMMLEGTVQEMSLIDWNRTLSVNLTVPFLLIKHSIPHLSGHGSIVNVSSFEGLGSNPRHPAYCASKGGLHALTRAVAVDHGPDGIRCNAIAPD